jgi:peptidyl-prolyl cis-trans isomerase C
MNYFVIDGVEIPEQLIRDEMPNHPAATSAEAHAAAAHALAIKALLLDRARDLGLDAGPEVDDAGRLETADEALIRRIFEVELTLQAPTETECLRFYESRQGSFQTPDLYEASHILLLESARDIAVDLVRQLCADPSGFSGLAKALSQCPSAKAGGALGQMQRGDLVAEIEEVLLNMPQGAVYPEPVQSRFGWHILRLDRRIPRQRLPFEAVRERIRMHLESRAWVAKSARYVEQLVTEARSRGIALRLDDAGKVEPPSLSLGALIDDERLAERITPWLMAADPVLAERVAVVARSQGVAVADLVRAEVRQFLDHANDESFTQLVSAAQGAQDPMLASVACILKSRLAPPKRNFTLIRKS